MKRSSYGQRDYAFGQTMLTLRTTIGLTQAGLADLLGVSRPAVAEWEAGSSYPKAEHLKAFLALTVGQQAFPAGREEEEIRVLWQAAHQNQSGPVYRLAWSPDGSLLASGGFDGDIRLWEMQGVQDIPIW